MTSAVQRSSARPTQVLVTGEFAFSVADFRAIAELAKAEAGIDLAESKATLVYSRLAKRLRSLGLAAFAEYCSTVRSNDIERGNMIAALTTNVTRFFREPHHFEHLRKNILEPHAARIRKGGRLRLWSSACSSGEEPYSIALTVLSVFPNAAELDIRILATDLNPNVVAHGKLGQYRKEDLADVPQALRVKWLEAVPGESDSLRLCDEARALVAFRELNLMGTWPFKGPFDAIFCRNVAIYFDHDTQGVIWRRLSNLLVDDGALYIGHSERVSGPALNVVKTDGVTSYRKKGVARQ
jgi:chemotaxis protein methyltransferase CheR